MRGPEGDRKRGRLREAHARGHRKAHALGDDALLRHRAPAHRHPRDAVAHLESADVGAALGDDARALAARNERHAGLLLVRALDHQDVGEIQTRRVDPHLDPVRRASRRWNVLDGQRAPLRIGVWSDPRAPGTAPPSSASRSRAHGRAVRPLSLSRGVTAETEPPPRDSTRATVEPFQENNKHSSEPEGAHGGPCTGRCRASAPRRRTMSTLRSRSSTAYTSEPPAGTRRRALRRAQTR